MKILLARSHSAPRALKAWFFETARVTGHVRGTPS